MHFLQNRGDIVPILVYVNSKAPYYFLTKSLYKLMSEKNSLLN